MASKVARVVEAVEGWLYRRSQMGRVMAAAHQTPQEMS